MRSLLRVGVGVSSFGVPFAIAAYHADRRGGYDFGSRFHWGWLVAYSALFLLSAFVIGVPTLVDRVRHAVFGSIIAALTPLSIASVFFVLYDPNIPRFILVASSAVMLAVFTALSVLNVAWIRKTSDNDAVFAVLAAEESEALRAEPSQAREKRFHLANVVSPDEFDGDVRLKDRVKEAGANLIVLSETAQQNPALVSEVARLHEDGIRVRGLGSFYDEWFGKLPLSELRRTGMWFDIRDLHERFYQRLKRLMDISAAVVLLPALLISLPVVAVLNRMGNRGPLFFAQDRIGHRGAVFRIRKFRTMLPQTSADGQGVWTAVGDPRITKIGGLLRKSHLDELPQILNLLEGSLSIVGPRPEQPHYVESLSEQIPFYGLRHAVRPGLTGWAQVKFPYGASVEDSLEKLQFDLYYLRHQSLALDLRVCVRTVSSVLFRRGR